MISDVYGPINLFPAELGHMPVLLECAAVSARSARHAPAERTEASEGSAGTLRL